MPDARSPDITLLQDGANSCRHCAGSGIVAGIYDAEAKCIRCGGTGVLALGEPWGRVPFPKAVVDDLPPGRANDDFTAMSIAHSLEPFNCGSCGAELTVLECKVPFVNGEPKGRMLCGVCERPL